MQDRLEELGSLIPQCMMSDQARFRRRIRRLRRDLHRGKTINQLLDTIHRQVIQSATRREQRQNRVPRTIDWPDLPVIAHKQEITDTVNQNQVVIVCGETGSGKTTQLPKMCLEMGRGVQGMIGHTQPRRVAARRIAARLCEELHSPFGKVAGYKVRFDASVNPESLIKVMTDGILLAEIQHDRRLHNYDTIILDEAHERSLNIDFLLGYFKQLLPRRQDLKLIITSATIDPERFSSFFNHAPVIEVSGRSYPVDVQYRPLASENDDEQDRDQLQAILDAVDELAAIDPNPESGDILVFLAGEREIRDTAKALRQHHPQGAEILPLYARLSAQEQNRVFQPLSGRRIVLATNVAETSLTVPGVHYVVDPGCARISRYSVRSRVQRLPIEPISQASANQRAGRCGRLADGVCIRLYSEEDFDQRYPFTEPEISRTNLASVILQMKNLQLGQIEDFPFLDQPKRSQIQEGYRTLFELGAIDDNDNLTQLGRSLAPLPIDPRLGRMLLQAVSEDCLSEALIIVSAMSIQDPRERPLESADQADTAHETFKHEKSDFLGFLNLWDAYHEQKRHLSWNKLRKWCREKYLSFVRMREWHDIHQQLRALLTQRGFHPNSESASSDAIHRALLAGLPSQIAQRQKNNTEYSGANGMKLHIFPGSCLFQQRPAWIVAGEIVETTRRWARVVARIDARWLEDLASHLLSRSYDDPYWDSRSGRTMVRETLRVYGLEIISRRPTPYAPVNPQHARELFIQAALVKERSRIDAPFMKHNHQLIEEVKDLEAKQRRRDVLVDETDRFTFYEQRVAKDITDLKTFERWRKKKEKKTPQRLFMSRSHIMKHDASGVTDDLYPDSLDINNVLLPLEYVFEPGTPDDGVTLQLPLEMLNQVSSSQLEWLIPGMLHEKIVELIKTLPKKLRRDVVPAPDYARACILRLDQNRGSLTEELGQALRELTGIEIPVDAWQPESIPDHLRMNLNITDPDGNQLGQSRDLHDLRKQFQKHARHRIAVLTSSFGTAERDNITAWDFGELPQSQTIIRREVIFQVYPALVDCGSSVAIRCFDSHAAAQQSHRAGVRRLFILQCEDEITSLINQISKYDEIALFFSIFPGQNQFEPAYIEFVADRIFLPEDSNVYDQSEFQQRLATRWHDSWETLHQAVTLIETIQELYRDINNETSSELPPYWDPILTDIHKQLRDLFPRQFLTTIPFNWLQQYPRFLRGIMLRIEKARQRGLQRDDNLQMELDPLLQRYHNQLEHNAEVNIVDPELEYFRWMLEEFRISLFAQELGTSLPISVKRLNEQWQKVHSRI